MQTIESKELGTLSVDAGDVVCFSADQVLRLMDRLGLKVHDYDDFIKQTGGIECQFAADGRYAIDKVTALDKKGDEYDAILIGAPQDCVGLAKKQEDKKITIRIATGTKLLNSINGQVKRRLIRPLKIKVSSRLRMSRYYVFEDSDGTAVEVDKRFCEKL